MSHFSRLLLYLVLIASPLAGLSADLPGEQQASIPVHFVNREITDVVGAIARATGSKLIYGDDLTGRISVTVPERVTPGEALELLNAVLFVKGFAMIPMEDGFQKIVKVAAIAGSAPREEGPLDSESDRPITTLVNLEKVDADTVATALAVLTSKSSVTLAYPPTNSIILAGSEGQVARLIGLSRLIDRAANETLMVRSLRYRDADTVADILWELTQDWEMGGRPVEIWSNSSSNQVIVRAPPLDLVRLREMVENLDQPVVGGGRVEVVRILNRDVEEVSDLLHSLASGEFQQSEQRERGSADIGEQLIGRPFNVSVDEATNSLILVSDVDTIRVLMRLIATLDVLPPRVVVDVLAIEISRPTSFEFAIDYFLPVLVPSNISDPLGFLSTGANVTSILENPLLADTGVPSKPNPGTTLFGRYARAPLQIPFTVGDEVITIPVSREDVMVQAGETFATSTVLVRPHLVVVSGEEHQIFVGDNIPVPVSSSSSNGSGNSGLNPALSRSQSIERVDVGIDLRLTPTVGREGFVKLDLEFELSGLTASQAGSVEDVGPTLTERKISAKVLLSEGQFAVIGTGLGQTETRIHYGIPFLKDIPGLGYLFGGVQESTLDNDLVIIVSARVMKDMDEQVADSIRRRLAFERSVQRVNDLIGADSDGYAVLLDTVGNESEAQLIADSFTADGFETRVSQWDAYGESVWDIYIVHLSSFDEAGSLSRALSDAGWEAEITLLSHKPEAPGF